MVPLFDEEGPYADRATDQVAVDDQVGLERHLEAVDLGSPVRTRNRDQQQESPSLCGSKIDSFRTKSPFKRSGIRLTCGETLDGDDAREIRRLLVFPLAEVHRRDLPHSNSRIH